MAIDSIETQMRIIDNKLKLARDKVQEFIEQSIKVAIEEANNPKVTSKEVYEDKLEFLVT